MYVRLRWPKSRGIYDAKFAGLDFEKCIIFGQKSGFSEKKNLFRKKELVIYLFISKEGDFEKFSPLTICKPKKTAF